MTTDAAREALAASAGLSPRWTDNSGAERIVAPDVLAAAQVASFVPLARAGRYKPWQDG